MSALGHRIAAALALAASPAVAAPAYEIVSWPSPANAARNDQLRITASAVADFDGDGRVDLATLLENSSFATDSDFYVRIQYQNASGGLVDGPRVRTHWDGQGGYGFLGGFLRAADMDGDGRAELLLVEQHRLDDEVSIATMRRQPDGTFVEIARTRPPRVGMTLLDMRVSRVDAGNTPDLVLALGAGAGATFMTLHGRTDGTFRTPSYALAYDRHAVLADADGDGRPDLVGRLPAPHDGFSVAWGDASAQHFEQVRALRGASMDVDGADALLEVGDFNGDGRPGIAAMYVDRVETGDEDSGFVQYFHHQLAIYDVAADRSLTPGPVYRLPLQSQWHEPDILRADLDGDGDDDLVMSFNGIPELALQTPAGFEFASLPFAGGGSVSRADNMAAADFDGDGCVDIGIAMVYAYVVYRRTDCAQGAAAPLRAEPVPAMPPPPVPGGRRRVQPADPRR